MDFTAPVSWGFGICYHDLDRCDSSDTFRRPCPELPSRGFGPAAVVAADVSEGRFGGKVKGIGTHKGKMTDGIFPCPSLLPWPVGRRLPLI